MQIKKIFYGIQILESIFYVLMQRPNKEFELIFFSKATDI